MKGRVWSNREKRYLSHDENFCLALAEYCDRSEERNIYRIVVCNPDWQSYDLVQDDDLIFELSSGLEDKNGKEICEGDIVKVEDDEYTNDHDKFLGYNATVIRSVLKPGAFVVKNWWGERLLQWDVKLRRVEVIGNIHENPELIGKEEE